MTVIEVTDPRRPPVSVNPFEPAPGCGVNAHADRLAGLFESVFRPPDPVRTVLRLALRQVYADCGWDLVTGAARSDCLGPPGIPSLPDVRRAAFAAAAELDRDPGTHGDVRGFVDAKLGSLWLGPAGRFLAGGHPADVPALLRRKTIFTVGEVADDEAAAFLTGALLIRVAEQLRTQAAADPPSVVVVAVPVARLRRLLDEIRSYGTEVLHAHYSQTVRPPAIAPPATGPAPAGLTTPAPLRGRRSVACGQRCRERPCSGYELHQAAQLAADDSQVWLRLWIQALVLAFLTGRPLPRLPGPARRGWATLDARTRECVLATIVHGAVTSRARALRRSYDPDRLIAAVASTAITALTAVDTRTAAGPFRAGQVWVIPQLRWLHETERLCPLGQHQVRRDDIAPPLDFELSGLADWPGIRVADRLDALRRHHLSMDAETNRLVATTALLGTEQDLDADLATAGIGLGQQQRLSHAARMLGATQAAQAAHAGPGWLEVVLSWPARFIRPDGERAVSKAETG